MRISASLAGTLATTAAAIAATIVVPMVADAFEVMQYTLYVVLGIYTLSLAYIWGLGGILCFGQGAFFGLGGYTFAIAAINMGETTVPFFMAIAVAAAVAAALGYFMFYGRLSDVYLGVVTLVFTLIIWKLINSTAGPEYMIGTARLGGFNGIPSVPPLNVPGDPNRMFDPVEVFYIAAFFLIATYLLLKFIQATRFGRLSVAVKENEVRASLLGYDVRMIKLLVFTIGGAIAGLGGALYAAYQSFIDPNAFSLEMSAKVLIWVMAGGVGTFVGPLLACFGLQALSIWISTVPWANSLLVLGGILCFVVLLLPKGLLPGLADLSIWLMARARRAPPEAILPAPEGERA